ncbi:ferritin-like domain-containing protein [Hydrogenophaga sp.]|uniref:ferritin-like domain-containing protein n=1 Tax=Hydrogenophaga sp. TaxID=1904254 RepID=UPI0019CED5EA|nr:ferritin-like domain-containing protein [Hydrogenophaga sp.]MBD3892355.1 ferritin [Hydrogenophaga sp.]
MNADPRTLGWLGRALTHELGAVQQYLAQAVLADLWGEQALAQQLRREADEELQHAQRLMERLLLLGVAPAAGPLAPARLGRQVDELLRANRQLELEAVRLYQEALMHARRVRDVDGEALMQALLQDEIAHLAAVETLLVNVNGAHQS